MENIEQHTAKKSIVFLSSKREGFFLSVKTIWKDLQEMKDTWATTMVWGFLSHLGFFLARFLKNNNLNIV